MQQQYKPVRGQGYTLLQIRMLDLLDSPHLGVYIDDLQKWCPIQDTCVETEQEDTIYNTEGIRDLQWTYIRTTSEWIPVFRLSPEQSRLAIEKGWVTVEPEVNNPEESRWVCWSHAPREQYSYR